tara:strand:- start:587 stop:1228 length:642 start_codon:yes stop_codon:yes gene_type:complete
MNWKEGTKKVWTFFWKDDSIWSWIANIVVAFLVIKFILYPLLGLLLGTSFPIVAVVSESMEHGIHNGKLCDQYLTDFPESFDSYWQVCGSWYEDNGVTKEQFYQFPFKNGFNKGDVIVLWRPTNLKVGDILVFQANKPQPIIHRIVKVFEEDNQVYYQTKGDHNSDSDSNSILETKISQERLLGKGIVRIPYLGWLKILFVDAVRPLGINIQR